MYDKNNLPEPTRLMEEIVIRPAQGIFNLDPSEIWRYRELFYVLSRRSILARYKQTLIGIAWVMLQPLVMMGLLLFVFNYLAHMQTPPLAVFTGILAWQIFSVGFNRSAMSVVGDSNLVTKTYFPRLIIPTSSCIVATVDFLFTLIIFICIAAAYGKFPGARIIALPFFFLLAFVPTLGAGYLFSALNVKYRDIKHLVPFLVQIGFYASPIGYLTSKVPSEVKHIYYLNPMATVIDGFRWSLLDDKLPKMEYALISIGSALAIFLLGLFVFQRMEHTFADEI